MQDKNCRVCLKEFPGKIELALHYEDQHGGLDNVLKMDMKSGCGKRGPQTGGGKVSWLDQV